MVSWKENFSFFFSSLKYNINKSEIICKLFDRYFRNWKEKQKFLKEKVIVLLKWQEKVFIAWNSLTVCVKWYSKISFFFLKCIENCILFYMNYSWFYNQKNKVKLMENNVYSGLKIVVYFKFKVLIDFLDLMENFFRFYFCWKIEAYVIHK
jgi:hypothetical protein